MELKPCPFCGGNVIYTVTTVGAYRCTKCETVIIISSQSGDAKHEFYNTRHNEPPAVDEVPPLDSQRREVRP